MSRVWFGKRLFPDSAFSRLRKAFRLRTALHAKAKDESDFRFYALYDKIYRPDVLEHAYVRCRANKGAAGVDGVTFEAYGRGRWIGELAQQLREESYRPDAVRRSIFRSRTANRGLSAFRRGRGMMFSPRVGCARCACSVR